MSSFELKPIGYVRKKDEIEILEEFIPAMDGLSEGMLIWVLYIFHLSTEKIRVHPKGDTRKPLRGVFSTRSPYRINKIGLSAVKIRKIEKNIIKVDGLDALENSPVVDIKPFAEVYDVPYGSVLSAEDILKRIRNENLITDYIDLETQIQPNGFDCTLKKVSRIKGMGRIDFDNSERVIPETLEIEFDENGWVFLEKGVYRATLNEIVSLSEDIMAFARPRSTLIRSGANVLTAVWDAGYRGRSEVGIVVYNSEGIMLKKDARIVQLVFIKLTERTKPYNGVYLNENI
ncbi:putative methyltransferase, YaeB/AF_0241 family [Archaeoglobus sulfaticallidus PM70-1]|uniref:Probable deoxyuridine 5'-triphosphate nucleotidohydrolase n=1 Tax=Archaeoglobus sulfaticallidus PM70-1 TaxID=387631 RepID=N0BKK5_9EURY|nr:deoxyuridine 5'-triphosphate nucleotidohydrolase [Archaeoglobus sulfaticallidus]AGK61026.1 putative methyltransferase, YaeB/AF_0241 family [Archaeoglobus sulfaticallidus PM70-1]